LRPIDPQELRRALAQFPTGVTVVSTMSPEGRPVALTVNSFNSVSMQPPLILWSVTRQSYSAGVFERVEHCVVNVLGKQQVELSNRCASSTADRLAGIDYR